MKFVGKIYQQTFVDTYSKVTQVKLYTEKSAITADIINDRMLPFYTEQALRMLAYTN